MLSVEGEGIKHIDNPQPAYLASYAAIILLYIVQLFINRASRASDALVVVDPTEEDAPTFSAKITLIEQPYALLEYSLQAAL